MTKYTPMIEQYLAIKAEVQDAFLFFRLGDFYEMFFEDALQASKELEITLTGKDGGAEERIPMCGVPYHSADHYIAKLIDKGYKVAICEQVEDPAEAKGIVRREIIRIVTPGTVMEGNSLGETVNNFIVCIAETAGSYGITACDLSTGEFYAAGLSNSIELLLDEMNIYSPSELIGDAALMEKVRRETANQSRAIPFTEWNRVDEELVIRHFPTAALAKLSAVELRAVQLMMSYLQETQKRALGHITRIQTYQAQQFMILDPFTRRNLELTETIRDRSKKGSLLWMLDQTVTSMGARMLRRWIDKPLMNTNKIEERQEAVRYLYHQLIAREDLREQLKEVYDLERLIGRISYGNANARDFAALKSSLQRVPELVLICHDSDSSTLRRWVEGLDPCADVLQWIEAAIVDEPPVSIKDGGMIRTGYHAYLDQLKEAGQNGKQWISELERKEREITGIKSLKLGFNKVFGYYIEVTKANLSSLPEGRYERKQTLANAERFVTPELKEKEALILEAQEKMVDIEYELFMQLRNQIAEQTPRLQKLAEVIAVIDCLQSLATVSAQQRYSAPTVSETYDLIIEEGRHPVVEAMLNGGKFMDNHTDMREHEGRMLLITGPNMAGKSTYMRQVALICIMAQIGCFVPATSAKMPLIDRIFTRIGAADDLVSGQSTFMVEMMDIQIMTEKATPQSLVIIDELGRGTSTNEGMSIAQAVIEFLHNQVGCKTLVSTHFHELAHLEDELKYLRNYCMAVSENGDQVTFLRKLVQGAASTSYGIYCARIAGLPESIITRAYALLHGMEANAAVKTAATQAAAGAVQLSMFGEEFVSSVKPVRKPEARMDSAATQVAEKIKQADLMNMTPLQAMQFIQELKQQL